MSALKYLPQSARYSTVLNDLLASITGRFRRSDGPVPVDAVRLDSLCAAIVDARAEASSVSLSNQALDRYDELTVDEKHIFFKMLKTDFGLSSNETLEAARAYHESHSFEALQRLLVASEPSRQNLLRRLNQATRGTLRLVQMRSDLLQFIEKDDSIRDVDLDFLHLFSSWFNRGFLELRRIDWDTSASILGKIIEYEAVHQISDWDDLRRRIDPPDRRLYAFFHPRLPNEPLVFVEIALANSVASDISDIIGRERTDDGEQVPTTAIFYSISNCQDGLRGVSFGNLLIKQVVSTLRAELPSLTHFVTLSPVPGFARWVERVSATTDAPDHLMALAVKQRTHEPEWWIAPDHATTGDNLRVLAARYLMLAKRDDGQPIDPVERFHLGNGACLDRINWPGNLSRDGLKSAYGVMVNYVYDLDKIDANGEALFNEHRVVASPEVVRLVVKGDPTPLKALTQ